MWCNDIPVGVAAEALSRNTVVGAGLQRTLSLPWLAPGVSPNLLTPVSLLACASFFCCLVARVLRKPRLQLTCSSWAGSCRVWAIRHDGEEKGERFDADEDEKKPVMPLPKDSLIKASGSAKEKAVSKPVSELDLSNSDRCGPSYRMLPKNVSAPPWCCYSVKAKPSKAVDMCIVSHVIRL